MRQEDLRYETDNRASIVSLSYDAGGSSSIDYISFIWSFKFWIAD